MHKSQARLDDLTTLVLLAFLLSLVGCRRSDPPARSAALRESAAAPVATIAPARPKVETAVQNCPPAEGWPAFRMVGSESGLNFTRYDDIRGQHRLLEGNGGGVGLLDFDNDGWLDVFLTSGCHMPPRPGDHQTPSRFFRNRTNMRFEDVTTDCTVRQFGYAHGCAVGDYNADGFDDLYVTAFGENSFWQNNGDGTFTDIAEHTGTTVPAWSSSAAFADLDHDGDLDLYVVNYLDDSQTDPRLCTHPTSPDGYIACPPAMYDGVDDAIYLSDGASGFVDATSRSRIAGFRGKGLGVVICNLDQTGLPEIYVANDGQANFLFAAVKQTANGTTASGASPELIYRELALSSGLALSEAGYAQASMGVAAGDYDASGTSDLFLTHFYEDTNTLYSNRGGFWFDEVTRASRLGPPSRRSLGFGTVFVDVDNDGWLDLFVANGHIDDRTWMGIGEPYRMPPQLFRNEEGQTFTDLTGAGGEYFLQSWLGRGVAAGDLDGNGLLDLVVSHQLDPSLALQNQGPSRHGSLVIRLVGVRSNRNGFGARVRSLTRTPVLMRELVGGGSYQSASAAEIHLGLGDHTKATIEIQWPSGQTDLQTDLVAGHWTIIESGRAVYNGTKGK